MYMHVYIIYQLSVSLMSVCGIPILLQWFYCSCNSKAEHPLSSEREREPSVYLCPCLFQVRQSRVSKSAYILEKQSVPYTALCQQRSSPGVFLSPAPIDNVCKSYPPPFSPSQTHTLISHSCCSSCTTSKEGTVCYPERFCELIISRSVLSNKYYSRLAYPGIKYPQAWIIRSACTDNCVIILGHIYMAQRWVF